MDLPRSQTMMSAYADIYKNTDQLDEVAPAIAALAGKAAGGLAAKGAGAGAAKMGGTAAKMASSKLGQKAIGAGSQAVGNKVQSSLSNEEVESYTSAYLEGFKPMDLNKMQDKAAMKPDTAKGEKQARKIDKIRAVGKHAAPEQEEGAKLQAKLNKVNPLKRAFKKPSFDKTKNKAYGLEQKRRSDLDKRYGPKKEEVAEFLFDQGYALSEESAEAMALHLSDEFLDSLTEEMLDEGKTFPDESPEDRKKRKREENQKKRADNDAAKGNEFRAAKGLLRKAEGKGTRAPNDIKDDKVKEAQNKTKKSYEDKTGNTEKLSYDPKPEKQIKKFLDNKGGGGGLKGGGAAGGGQGGVGGDPGGNIHGTNKHGHNSPKKPKKPRPTNEWIESLADNLIC